MAGSCDPGQAITALTAQLFQSGNLLATLTYTPPLTTVPNFFALYQNNVFALDTGLIGPRFNEMVLGNTPYWLQFGFVNDVNGPLGIAPRVYLFDGTCGFNMGDSHSSCNPNMVPLLTADTVIFAYAVPEPGTLALLFAAAAVALLARVRTRADADRPVARPRGRGA